MGVLARCVCYLMPGIPMGNSGSGRISDYPGSSPSGSSKSGAGNGNTPPEDRCAKAFSARLEDVELSDFYQNHGRFPDVGTQLEIALRKRLVAQTTTGESVGNLPTSFNYLAACIKDGWRYVGSVESATSGPPEVSLSADFAATSPS